jgi:hypothetical protein
LQSAAHSKALHELSRKEELEDQVSSFLRCCLQFLNDPEVTSKLTQMSATCMREQEVEVTISAPLAERDVCKVSKQKRTGREFKMIVELGGYDMDGVMLDLDSDLNILHKKSWEVMGKPKLV